MPSSRKRSKSSSRTSTIRISNLPLSFEVADLTELFSGYGFIRSVCLDKSLREGILDLTSGNFKEALSELQSKGWSVSEWEDSPSPCEYPLIWSGFFSRSLTRRVGVDAYLLKGDFSINHNTYHIDIPYRAPFPSKEISNARALLIFEAENLTHLVTFNEYIKYFMHKGRVGYTSLSAKEDLYILPPSAPAFQLAPSLRKNQMLGVVCTK